MQTANSLISVVIPAYNAEKTLAETLESVFAQTYPNIEIVVVDDGSTDATPAVLDRYAGRIRVVKQANCGLAGARNAGCAAASGEYIALMDADDLCRPYRLTAQMAALGRFPQAVLCAGDFSAFNEQGTIAERYAARYYSRLAAEHGQLDALFAQRATVEADGMAMQVNCGNVYTPLMFGNFLHPPTLLFPATTLKIAGRFDPRFKFNVDWTWIVAAARCGDVAFVDAALIDYRLTDSQMSGLRNRAIRARDTIDAVERLWKADPELAAELKSERRRQRALNLVQAADAHADSEKALAFKWLWSSLWDCGYLSLESFRILTKAALPGFVLQKFRRIMGRNPDGSPRSA